MYKITVPTIISNGHFNKEKTLQELKRCRADRVALALDREMDYAFSSPENLELLKELLTYYRQNGLETLVWLGESLGHDRSPADEKIKSKYKNMIIKGQGAVKSFCPMDEAFVNDYCKWVKDVALCGADMIMIDDDYGLRGGCCCKEHMDRIREILQEEISDEAIFEAAFTGGQNRYRDAWMQAQDESMMNLSRRLRSALDSVNPNARLGVCAVPWGYDLDGGDMTDMVKALAGNTRPFVRLFGAPYHSYGNSRLGLAETIEAERLELGWISDPDIEIFSEGDTYPRPRFYTPASYLECYDTALRADGRMSGILKYMLDYVSDADYETGYIDFMAKNESLYRQIEEVFENKKAVGVKPYIVPHTFRTAHMEDGNVMTASTSGVYPYIPIKFAVQNSLPAAYDGDGVNILFGENARHIPEAELDHGSIIDITAAKILMERGIDVGIEVCRERNKAISRSFTELPSQYFVDEQIYIRLSGNPGVMEVEKKPGAKVLTKYVFGKIAHDFIFTYENIKGQRFLVLPFRADLAAGTNGYFEGYALRRLLVKSIAWLSGKKQEVLINGNHPMLYSMIKKNTESLAVGIWNLFADRIDRLELDVQTGFSSVRYINCSGHAEENKIILDSTVYPYEFAAVEVIY